MSARFVKKAVEIEAVKFTGDNWPQVGAFARFRHKAEAQYPQVAEVYDELHGTWVGVKVGDWIIRGIKGETYPCDPEVFVHTYEPVHAE